MRISRVGIIVILTLTMLFATNCSVYNTVIARKNLVDGANAFNNKKLDEAEQLFRSAVKYAPVGTSESKTALLFLARTLHSKYASNRNEKAKAEEAINYYQKVLAENPADNSSFKAVASLYDILDRKDDWNKWITDRTLNTGIPPEQRAEAFTSLAAKQNSCANDITEMPEVKKTVTKDGKSSFTFSKPTKPEDLETLRVCVQKGSELIAKAMELETDKVKSAGSVDIKLLSDKDLAGFGELVGDFESARSFNTSLISQSMHLAEMEGRTADKDKLKVGYDAAKESYKQLAEINRGIKNEVEARAKAKAEAANGPSNANTAGNTNTK